MNTVHLIVTGRVRTCSLVLAGARPRLGFGSPWHQSAASSSDSAPCSGQTRRCKEPRSAEGLHSSSQPILGSDTNPSYEGQLQTDSIPATKSKSRLSNKCIAFVRSSLGLKSKSTRAPQDAIFIAIDTEGTRTDLTELGISTFDTRDIKNLCPGPSALEWSKHIKPRQFRFKAGQRQPFLFGAVEHRVPLAAIRPYLRLRPDRLYILVGHAVNHDVGKLAHVLGYELRNESNIVAIVDTFALAQQCRTTLPGRLSKLWRFLVNSGPGDVTPADVIRLFSPNIRTADLNYESSHAFHNAGNDAFYNMHTLLMLALQPELLREPKYSSSLAGVFLRARSSAWQLVRRLTNKTPTSNVTSMAPGSFVARPEGVASIQPPQSTGTQGLTICMRRPKTQCNLGRHCPVKGLQRF